MPQPVSSTYKILKEKSCNADIHSGWIDWAMEMIQAGFEVESLYELAGITVPYNQFELHDLTNRVLDDLNLDYSNKEKVLEDYAYYLISSHIEHKDQYSSVLKDLVEIYDELNMAEEYQNFADLYWAKMDLETSDVQWYWPSANKENIDNIIKEQFELWLKKLTNLKSK